MIWHMTVKDLKRMMRDRKALLITILMPAILIAILGFSIGGLFSNGIQLEPARVAVVNLDDITRDRQKLNRFLSEGMIAAFFNDASEKEALVESVEELDFSQILIEDVLGNEKIKEFISYQMMDEKTALEQLEKDELTAVIVIPQKFSYDVWVNMFFPLRNQVKITIWSNPDHELRAGIVKSIIQGYTDRLSAGIVGKNSFLEASAEFNGGAGVYQEMEEFMKELMDQDFDRISTEAIAVDGMNPITGFQYYAVGMSAMFILFTAVYGAGYSLNEREFHTWERMQVAGRGIYTILSARFIAMILFTFLQLSVLIAFSYFMFGVDWGSWNDVFLLTAVVSLSTGSLSALLSVINLIFNSDRISVVFQAAVIPLISILGGSFVPTSSMPAIFRNLGDLTMNGATLDGYFKIMQGYSLTDLQPQMMTLILTCMVLLATTAVVSVRIREV